MPLPQSMMPFHRRTSLVPVNSIKHIIDTVGTSTGAALSITPIADAVAARSAVFNPVEVLVGRKINAFFLSVFFIGPTGSPVSGSINWYIAKLHAGQSALTPQPGATGTSELRNQIIHEEKGLVGSGDGTAMAFKGVIVIPKGMRRMREGDQWVFVNRMQGGTQDDTQFCFKSIHKSFG